MTKRKQKGSGPKENTDMSKTGKVTRKGEYLSMTPLSPDHPIYGRGYVVGGNYTSNSSKSTGLRDKHPEIKEFLDTQLPQEVREQMSGDYQPEPTGGSGWSTGPTKKGSKS